MSKEDKGTEDNGFPEGIFDLGTEDIGDEIFKHVDQMYDGIDTKTDINLNERNLLMRLDTLRRMEDILYRKLQLKKEDNPISIEEMSEKFKLLSISLKRQSRKEFFEIFKPISQVIVNKKHFWRR